MRAIGEFVTEALEAHGAAAERVGPVVECLLPDDLSRRLSLPTEVRLALEGPPAGGEHAGGFGSAALDALLAVFEGEGCLMARRHAGHYLKKEGFQSLLAKDFSFPDAVASPVMPAPATLVPYLVVDVAVRAVADERADALVRVAVNALSGAAVPETADALVTGGEVLQRAVPLMQGSPAILDALRLHARRQAARALAPFREAVARRLAREAERIEHYYAELIAEHRRAARRAHKPENRQRSERRMEAARGDLERRREDLAARHRVTVRLRGVAGCWAVVEAVRLPVLVRVGREERTLYLTCNPLSKSLEAIPCEACGEDTRVVRTCRVLHAVCPACRRRCPVCGRDPCRRCQGSGCGCGGTN